MTAKAVFCYSCNEIIVFDMRTSAFALTLKYIAIDGAGSVLYFPIWWYTAGTVRAASFCGRTVIQTARSFGLGAWVKNFFRPMYGQRDIMSRLISLLMRFIVIAADLFLLFVLSVAMLALFLAWLFFPVFVGYELYVQFAGAFSFLPA
jgi:hypothetical protein